jgi:hypothetical protein
MKILIITDEVWNDEVHGNNILTNWFEGINADFANIYCSPGKPSNKICNNYFQITDKMVLKSLITKKKAGKRILLEKDYLNTKNFVADEGSRKIYRILKKITTETLRLLRDLIWKYGNYDTDGISQFIDHFSPDIIFSPRMATIKMLRVEKIVYDLAKVPIVAFTGDAEYTLKLLRLSPIFWIRRFLLRKELRKMMHNYSLYYTLSNEQKLQYESLFGYKFKILRKTGIFINIRHEEKQINKPITLIYAGKLYSNRWKTLINLVKAIKKLNVTNQEFFLKIYSKDKLSRYQNRILNDGYNSVFMGAVQAKDLKNVYHKADIVLHVESLDIKNRLLTKFSFSTKIIDCLESTCAVMVISWDKHSGYTYLESEDAAILVQSKNEILVKLREIYDNKNLINDYAEKAYECGVRNHQRGIIQKMLLDDFRDVINKSNVKS